MDDFEQQTETVIQTVSQSQFTGEPMQEPSEEGEKILFSKRQSFHSLTQQEEDESSAPAGLSSVNETEGQINSYTTKAQNSSQDTMIHPLPPGSQPI
mmetsp:Transcript_20356/g.31094  ORF Transcript_20356/g.31094 Transcript_20356/m.31094 type:complete len:97 (-) Transcript_20356:550-840(-)